MPKVRFYTATPIAINGHKAPSPLMFDGLLGYAWALMNGYTKNPAEIKPENLVLPELPLVKIGEKCYAASAAFVPPEARVYPTYIVKRGDWKEIMGRHSPGMAYNTESQWAAAKMENYWELSTPFIDFYYQPTNQNEVNKLLEVIWQIKHLGAKRAAGYGLINKIKIYRKAEDYSVWRDGVPTRPIPVSIAGEKPGLKAEWTTYYPPYWNMANCDWCYTPPVEQWLPNLSVSAVKEDVNAHFQREIERLLKL